MNYRPINVMMDEPTFFALAYILAIIYMLGFILIVFISFTEPTNSPTRAFIVALVIYLSFNYSYKGKNNGKD